MSTQNFTSLPTPEVFDRWAAYDRGYRAGWNAGRQELMEELRRVVDAARKSARERAIRND
jgi:hypothetical protein